MIEFLRERAKLVVAVVVVVVAIFAVRAIPSGGGTSDPTGAREVIAAPDLASDAGATTLLRQAGVAMETLGAQSGSFAAGAAGAVSVEPNITWITGSQANANANQVAVVADATTYMLATTSASGTVYTYSRDAAGAVVTGCGPGCSW